MIDRRVGPLMAPRLSIQVPSGEPEYNRFALPVVILRWIGLQHAFGAGNSRRARIELTSHA